MSSSAEAEDEKSSFPAVAAAGTNWRSPSPPPPPASPRLSRNCTDLGDDLHLRALAAVLRFPRRPVEATVHAYAAPLGQVVFESVGLVAKHFDVEEVRLVDPVAAFVLLPTVDRDSQLRTAVPDGRWASSGSRVSRPTMVTRFMSAAVFFTPVPEVCSLRHRRARGRNRAFGSGGAGGPLQCLDPAHREVAHDAVGDAEDAR